MKRIFLALLLLGLATLLIPGLRERSQPRIDQGREWLGQKLEGPLSPVLTPYRTLKTESRIAKVVSHLVRDRNRGRPPPTPGEFRDYLAAYGLDTLDAWGAPLLLQQEPDSVAIISAGADLDYLSDDDLVTRIRYRAPERRVLRRR